MSDLQLPEHSPRPAPVEPRQLQDTDASTDEELENAQPETKGLRRAMMVLALTTLGFTFYVMFFNPSFAHVAEFAKPDRPPKFNELPVSAEWTLFSLAIGARFLPFCLALYLGLAVNNSLPNKQFWPDLVYVATGCAPFVLLQAADIAVTMIFRDSLVTVGVVSTLVQVATVVAIMYVINQLVDIGTGALVTSMILFAVFTLAFVLLISSVETKLGMS